MDRSNVVVQKFECSVLTFSFLLSYSFVYFVPATIHESCLVTTPIVLC